MVLSWIYIFNSDIVSTSLQERISKFLQIYLKQNPLFLRFDWFPNSAKHDEEQNFWYLRDIFPEWSTHYIYKWQYPIISIGAWSEFQFTHCGMNEDFAVLITITPFYYHYHVTWNNIDRQREAWILWFMWNWEQKLEKNDCYLLIRYLVSVQFQSIVPFLYSLKRGYRNGTIAWNRFSKVLIDEQLLLIMRTVY